MSQLGVPLLTLPLVVIPFVESRFRSDQLPHSALPLGLFMLNEGDLALTITNEFHGISRFHVDLAKYFDRNGHLVLGADSGCGGAPAADNFWTLILYFASHE